MNAADRPPSFMLAITEPARAVLDLGMLSASALPLVTLAPRGDGHPVLILPGLLASNRSIGPLKRFLRLLGYEAYGWRLGRNLGARAIGVRGEHLEAELKAVFDRHGRKVSLIGWSLGGLMARVAASRRADLVRQVISMGSGFAGGVDSTNAGLLFEFASGQRRKGQATQALSIEAARLPPVPSTSIYSLHDGIVAWRSCLGLESATSENIRVYGSHCGLGFNPAVWYAIADRLGQAAGEWRPFAAPDTLEPWYPRPH